MVLPTEQPTYIYYDFPSDPIEATNQALTTTQPSLQPSPQPSEIDLGLEFAPDAPDNIVTVKSGTQRVQAWVENLEKMEGDWQDASQATAGGRTKARRVDRRENLRLQHSASPALRDANFDFPQRKNTQVDNSQDEEMNPTIRERFSAGPALESKNVTTTNANPILPQPRHQNLGAVRDYHYISKLEADPGTWLARSEVPTSNEIMMAPADDSIPRNITESAWESKEQYLSAHYELIREDAVLPLRAAVHQVRDYPTAPEEYFNGSIGVYDRVRVTGITCAPRGIAIRVAFSLGRAGKQIRWRQSKRLIQGSMVALTPASDMFRDKCIIATVAARPLVGLESNPPEIDLYFARSEELEIDPAVEWVMVEERSSYFEASRHVMTALQKLSREEFPLQEHLVDVKAEVEAPQYLLNNPMVDMSTAIEATDDESYQNVDVIGNWPVWGTGALRTTLDKSQFAALHTILSKRLAVVQGPPGTGKTHVSVVALKVLLANWRIGDPPIIVSCQTNHALDQLLRLVSVFEENFIRLGGRSKDTGVVREHTLYEIRMKRNSRPTAGGMAATSRARMNKLSKDISLLLNPLELGSQMLIDPNKLTQLGILTPEQGVSMQEGDQGYVNHNLPSEGAAPMSAWLGSQLQVVGRNLQKDDNYDYEEAELEFEDLQEIEAEAAAQDDENLEALTGQTYSIADNFTGRKQTRLSDSQIESLLQNQNLYDIPMKQRGSVYAHMQLQAKRIILKALREVTKEYNGLADQRRIGRFEQDLQLLREQKLIGVTTTGLSKYRPMLSALNPKIVLVEEAAETIEAPVAAACVPSLQHLILVGDHQQLRPQCSVKSLEGQPFNLNVSLFERMVLNEVEFSMLKRQRRMIPEVRRLLRPIYGKAIVDHPIVKSAEHRPPIPGMGGINSYFFTHEWMEERDENLSAFNRHEANMVAAFYNYLTYNGMEASQITVITFYNGQRKAIIKAIHRYPNLRSRTLKVVTVDSYQGEENEVILLSLVRSNEHYSIGFLNVDNRVCVALSRARRGFYLFGNAEILCSEHETWAEVVRIMAGSAGEKAPEPKKRIAFHLPLFCDKHQRKTFIEEPDDFDKINGGCEIVCGGQLPCGHPCELKCHPFDHSMVICDKPCIRNMECGHKCINDCGDPCRCAECRDNDSGDEPMETIQPQLQALSMNQAMYPGSIPISGTTAFGNPTGCYGSAPFGGTTLVTKRNLSGGTAAWNAFADGGYVKQDRKLFDNPHKTFDKWYGKLNRGLRTSSETLATSGTGSSGASRMAPKTPSPPSSFNSASLKKAIPLADSALSKPLVKAAEEAPTVIESVDTDEDIVERLQDSMSERKVFTTEVNLIDFD